MMTAIARMPMPETSEDDLPGATTVARPAVARPAIRDDLTRSPPVAATPWRAPLFYLAPIAAIFLLIAVAIVLLWRIVTRSRSL